MPTARLQSGRGRRFSTLFVGQAMLQKVKKCPLPKLVPRCIQQVANHSKSKEQDSRRGFTGHGCAEDELGLGGHDGIMVLDAEATVGQPLATHVGLEGDDVIEISLTPNRNDAGTLGSGARLAGRLVARHRGWRRPHGGE